MIWLAIGIPLVVVAAVWWCFNKFMKDDKWEPMNNKEDQSDNPFIN